MRILDVRFLIISAVSLFVMGCTKGVPTLEDLGLQMKGFWFQGGEESATFEADASGNATISGNCDPRIQSIKISFDNGTTWADASGSDTDCSDGSFTLSASMAAVTAQIGAFSMPSRRDFALQGLTKLGKTKQVSVQVRYGSFRGGTSAVVVGSVNVQSPSFRVVGRIGQVASGARTSSPSYSIKPGSQR